MFTHLWEELAVSKTHLFPTALKPSTASAIGVIALFVCWELATSDFAVLSRSQWWPKYAWCDHHWLIATRIALRRSSWHTGQLHHRIWLLLWCLHLGWHLLLHLWWHLLWHLSVHLWWLWLVRIIFPRDTAHLDTFLVLVLLIHTNTIIILFYLL